MKNNIYLALALSLFGTSAYAVNPSEVLISVYAIAVSESASCSNPIVVLDNGDTPVQYNFSTTPDFGRVSVAAGTYPCMILKMSDVIKFRPDATTGSCTGGTQYTIDVCRAGGGTYTPMTVAGGVGTYAASTACTGSSGTPVDTKVAMFLSTQSTNNGGGSGSAFDRPATAGTNGFTLSGAFTASGTTTGTFIVNFNNKIDGSGASCDLQPPLFGFR